MPRLAALASTKKRKPSRRGRWGQGADAIWALRLTDGFAAHAAAIPRRAGHRRNTGCRGAWRPTPQGCPPTARQPGRKPQIATMTPWVLTRPSQFRLPPPLALNSPEYAADLNEVKSMGVYSGSGRSDDQSELALSGMNTRLLGTALPAAFPQTRADSDRECALIRVTESHAFRPLSRAG